MMIKGQKIGPPLFKLRKLIQSVESEKVYSLSSESTFLLQTLFGGLFVILFSLTSFEFFKLRNLDVGVFLFGVFPLFLVLLRSLFLCQWVGYSCEGIVLRKNGKRRLIRKHNLWELQKQPFFKLGGESIYRLKFYDEKPKTLFFMSAKIQ